MILLLQEGSSETLYESVWSKIFSLPEHFTLFPAHDYQGRTATTVGEEKALNPRYGPFSRFAKRKLMNLLQFFLRLRSLRLVSQVVAMYLAYSTGLLVVEK